MRLSPSRWSRVLVLAAVVTLTGCGARSALSAPDLDLDAGAGGADAAPAERPCLPTCTVGHACCAGDCGGPPVPMPNACCACLPGEVSSQECPDAVCGG